MKTTKSGIIIGIIIGLSVVMAIFFTIMNAINNEKDKEQGKAFSYDLSELRKTDPALIKYKEIGSIPTGFQKPRAIAVWVNGSKERVYIAGDKSIKAMGIDGKVITETNFLDPPQCLAVDNNGTLYAGLKTHVEVYFPNGSLKKRWESLWIYAYLTSIAVYEDDIFVADAGNKVVWRYDKDGKILNQIGKKNDKQHIYGLVVPTPYLDIAVAPDGLLRVANPGLQRMEAYTFKGDMEQYWGQSSMGIEGFGGCSNPANFAIFPDGRFVTCEKGLTRVKIYSADGKFESVVAGAENFAVSYKYLITGKEEDDQVQALDVALGANGRIFVLDPDKKTVRIFVEK
ncbi:hypothetical protein FJZ33_10090 [Candidatus Poribacteria bacterium]|nr:hypothetical protein [Candidatus Poribacteria bacterium]